MTVEVLSPQEAAAAAKPPTASQRILDAAASQNRSVKTPDGKEVVYRTLEALDEMRLCAAVGPTLAANDVWMRYARLAASVVSIDAQPVSKATRAQLEMIVQRLGNVGLGAILDDMNPPEDAAGDAAGEAGPSATETFPAA